MATCLSCTHFDDDLAGIGRCRRYPPVLYAPDSTWRWPRVDATTDVCGEWRPSSRPLDEVVPPLERAGLEAVSTAVLLRPGAKRAAEARAKRGGPRG